MANDASGIYVTALRNTRALENQGLEQMERQLTDLEHYPDYANVLRRHVETTRGQIGRLDGILASLGESASSLKDTVASLAGSVGAMVHATAQDETLKNLFAGYAYQHDQIAAYRSLAVIAENAGHGDHATGFRAAAEEEKRAAEAIDALIEPVTRTYLGRTLRGEKASS